MNSGPEGIQRDQPQLSDELFDQVAQSSPERLRVLATDARASAARTSELAALLTEMASRATQFALACDARANSLEAPQQDANP